MYRLILVFTLFALALPIPGTAVTAGPPAASSYTAYKDLVYAGLSDKNRLDLYVPNGAGPHPLVVWVHGGGWQSGDKAQTPALFLAERGYAVASVNYRLSGEAIFPAQIHDVKAAVRWLRANAADYSLDPARIAAWGSSAGGHLVALLGTSGDVAALEDLSMGNAAYSSRVRAVVDWYGATDLLQMDAQLQPPCRGNHNAADSAESRLIGCAIQTCPEAAARANPITYVSADDPPFLLHHGTADCTVPPGQSQLLYAALQGASVPATLYQLEGAGHGGPAFSTTAVQQQVQDFLDSTLRAVTPALHLPLVGR